MATVKQVTLYLIEEPMPNEGMKWAHTSFPLTTKLDPELFWWTIADMAQELIDYLQPRNLRTVIWKVYVDEYIL